MSSDFLKTPRASALPTVLVGSASPEFVERCRRIASGHRIFVKVADFATVATAATRARPRVILMTHAVYARDPLEFDALARDLQAKLVRLFDEDVDDEDLDRAIAEAFVRRAPGR